MHPAVQRRVDRKRGCGWRKASGLYLVADGLSAPCGKLPLALDVCPTCGCGIKPCRGWTWVNATALFTERRCENPNCNSTCPLAGALGRAGLLWIGEAYYATPEIFLREADEIGVSRRISRVPRDFVLGQTWVLLAHRKAIANPDDTHIAAIFQVFRPQAIEYVVRGNESDEVIEKLVDRGITPVRVEHAGEPRPMFTK